MAQRRKVGEIKDPLRRSDSHLRDQLSTLECCNNLTECCMCGTTAMCCASGRGCGCCGGR